MAGSGHDPLSSAAAIVVSSTRAAKALGGAPGRAMSFAPRGARKMLGTGTAPPGSGASASTSR